MRLRGLFCVAIVIMAGAAAGEAPKAPFADVVKLQVKGTLDALQEKADWGPAEKALKDTFDQAVIWCPDERPDALREADYGLRLVRQLRHVKDDSKRMGLLKVMRANPTFGPTLVFLIRRGENPEPAYEMLDKLQAKRGEQLDKYATLAAAICVVHHGGKPTERQINENKAKGPDPIDVFDYYAKYESKMYFGIRNVPAELLAYVVDTSATVDEMTWALQKYGGDKEVGKRFFDVKYDYDHYRKGTPKKITTLGFNLPNILKYGGICADQAYFAMEVGKSIGVPTAYAVGESGESGHAWVGFLQSNGKDGWWNFDSGRYEEYRGVRGNVRDPQAHKDVPDSYVSLMADLIGTKPVDRHNAVAFTDAAYRLIELEKNAADVAAPQGVSSGTLRAAARKPDTAAQLALFELALRQCAGYAPAWFGVRDLATADKLSLADKRRWADVLIRLGAKKYPDFTLAILSPMISTISDAKEQDRLWATLFTMFQTRFDLAANIRMHEAAMWEKEGDTDKAGICYLDVIERYANAGPFVIDALKGAEKILKQSKRADKVPALYEQTWSKTKAPEGMAAQFMTQSNWYKVGKIYAKRLTEAGDTPKAKGVEAQLEKQMTAGAS